MLSTTKHNSLIAKPKYFLTKIARIARPPSVKIIPLVVAEEEETMVAGVGPAEMFWRQIFASA